MALISQPVVSFKGTPEVDFHGTCFFGWVSTDAPNERNKNSLPEWIGKNKSTPFTYPNEPNSSEKRTRAKGGPSWAILPLVVEPIGGLKNETIDEPAGNSQPSLNKTGIGHLENMLSNSLTTLAKGLASLPFCVCLWFLRRISYETDFWRTTCW